MRIHHVLLNQAITDYRLLISVCSLQVQLYMACLGEAAMAIRIRLAALACSWSTMLLMRHMLAHAAHGCTSAANLLSQWVALQCCNVHGVTSQLLGSHEPAVQA